MKIIKILKTILFSGTVYTEKNNYQIQKRFFSNEGYKEVKTFIKTEIIHDDKIGCSDEYKKFSKEVLMSQFNVDYDNIVFKCESVIDHKGIKHTKRYKEIKIPL